MSSEMTAREVIARREQAAALRARQAIVPRRRLKSVLVSLGLVGRQQRMFLKWMRRVGAENYCDTSATNAREVLASAIDKWRLERGFVLV